MRSQALGAPECARWPWWFAPVGVAAAFAVTGLVSAVVLGVVSAAGGDGLKDPTVASALTLLQDAAFIGVACALAASAGTLSFRALGLVPVRTPVLIGSAALALTTFLLFALLWAQLTALPREQDTLRTLGAEDESVRLVLTAVLVILIAPVAEEVLFRGLAYRSLRNAMPAWLAAVLVGSGFGAIHYSGPDSVGVLVPLAVLGAIFCLLYEWTGSLWTPIALHIANNALAVGATSEQDAAPVVAMLAGTAGVVAVVLCARRPSSVMPAV